MTQTPWMCLNPLAGIQCTDMDKADNPCGPHYDSHYADPFTQGQYLILSLYTHGLRGSIPPELALLTASPWNTMRSLVLSQ